MLYKRSCDTDFKYLRRRCEVSETTCKELVVVVVIFRFMEVYPSPGIYAENAMPSHANAISDLSLLIHGLHIGHFH